MAKKRSNNPERVIPEDGVEVRVLLDCDIGDVDDVVILGPDEVAAGVAAGRVDPHPDAVAYAKSTKPAK